MIVIKQKGDLSKVTGYFERIKEVFKVGELDKYGRKGVEALSNATPIRSGVTASSWSYDIENQNGRVVISFMNSNVNKGVNIAIILQYGHGTRNGGWVQGRDYINPAIRPVFDEMANEAWREVTEV